jgi:hypothetical protein
MWASRFPQLSPTCQYVHSIIRCLWVKQMDVVIWGMSIKQLQRPVDLIKVQHMNELERSTLSHDSTG